MNVEMDTWIQTLDGKKFRPLEPDPDAMNIGTIAEVLSRLPRFGGHTTVLYSVAQHSINVASLIETEDLRLPALLHDAHEAYTGFGDVCAPMKQALREYGDAHDDPYGRWSLSLLDSAEYMIDKAVARRFGFDPALFQHEEIRTADRIMLATEKKHIMSPEPAPWVDLPEPLSILRRDFLPARSFVRMFHLFGGKQ